MVRNGPIIPTDHAPPEFDFQFREETPPSNLTAILRTVDQDWSAQWIGKGGGVIHKDRSRAGLERVSIRCWSVRELEEIAVFVIKGAAPITDDELGLHPVYPDGGSFVGWIFWHPRRADEDNAL